MIPPLMILTPSMDPHGLMQSLTVAGGCSSAPSKSLLLWTSFAPISTLANYFSPTFPLLNFSCQFFTFTVVGKLRWIGKAYKFSATRIECSTRSSKSNLAKLKTICRLNAYLEWQDSLQVGWTSEQMCKYLWGAHQTVKNAKAITVPMQGEACSRKPWEEILELSPAWGSKKKVLDDILWDILPLLSLPLYFFLKSTLVWLAVEPLDFVCTFPFDRSFFLVLYPITYTPLCSLSFLWVLYPLFMLE